MASDPRSPGLLVGLMRIREHCTFTWRKPEAGGERTVEVRANHCLQCVAELRRRGLHLVNSDGSEPAGG